MYKKVKKAVFENWRKQSVILVTAFCLFLNAFALTIYFKNDRLQTSKDWVIHSYDVLRQSRLILIYVQDMEIGQRGFFLSDKKQFLKPYEQASKNLAAEISRLRNLIKDQPEQVEKLNDIDIVIKQHEDLLNDQISKFKSKKYTITIRDLEESSRLLDLIRTKIDNFQDHEKTLLQKREAEQRQRQKNFIETIIGGSLLSIVGILLASGFATYQAARRKKIEDALARSNEIYTQVTQGINEGIYEYDLINNTMYFSLGYKKMLGYEDNEFPNTIEMLNEHIHPEDFKQKWGGLNKFINGEESSYRNYFRLRHKDGHYLWIMSRGVALYDGNHKMIKIVGTHTDITEQKENEEYLKHLNTELENFTYITSHDLRSPLVNLRGFATEMQYSITEAHDALRGIENKADKDKVGTINRVLTADLPEALEYIKTSVDRLDQLTSAILDLSRIGRRELKIEKIDTHELVKKFLDTMAYEINNKKVDVKLGEMPEVHSDRASLQQIFANIIENAIKYLDDSRQGIINIKGHVFPGETQFIITDNGRGIAEHDKHRVFDMFKRARNVSEVRGVGMGMSFVKATVQRLGGKIWFESTLGVGTKFIFTIPNRTRRDATD